VLIVDLCPRAVLVVDLCPRAVVVVDICPRAVLFVDLCPRAVLFVDLCPRAVLVCRSLRSFLNCINCDCVTWTSSLAMQPRQAYALICFKCMKCVSIAFQ